MYKENDTRSKQSCTRRGAHFQVANGPMRQKLFNLANSFEAISHLAIHLPCVQWENERERERERGKGGRVFWEVLFMTITGAHALKIRSLLQVILNRCHCNMILWYNENMSEKAKKGTLSHHNLSQDCKGRAPKSKERGVWLGGWQEEKKGRSSEIIAR